MKKILFATAAIIALLLITGSAVAGVRLPRLISDGMVLQRDAEIKLWGWADPGEEIVVEFKGNTYTTKADSGGDWRLTLPPQPAGGPVRMIINNRAINNIMIGDVWVASGQSNMELPMRRVADLYGDEMRDARNTFIREYKVPLTYDFNEELYDYNGGRWVEVTPSSIREMSATVYFFAQRLHYQLGVPIGVINASVGGSPAEAWISEEGLKEFPQYIAQNHKWRDSTLVKRTMESDKRKTQAWFDELDTKDPGVGRWNRAADYDSWRDIELPGYWADKEPGYLNGSIWFSKEIEVPAGIAGKRAELRLGCIVDSDSVWVNGRFVGTTSYQYPPRIYTIPSNLLKEGKNRVTIRVISNTGRGGFVEDKTYAVIGHKDSVPLDGVWKYHIGAEMEPMKPTTTFQYQPVGLFNAMIAPIVGYPIMGFIWYQGESNTSRWQEYGSLLSALIADWRERWGEELPFIVAQLPNLGRPDNGPADSGWTMLREQQASVLELPKTAISVNYDTGEWNDIHPLNKLDVGYRLAESALNVAYGFENEYGTGPIFREAEFGGDGEVYLYFDNVRGRLRSHGKLGGFVISDEYGNFSDAQARIENGRVVVWNDGIEFPSAVRYAWSDNPLNANLTDDSGIPALPFRTDK